jgi:hypothetical protein
LWTDLDLNALLLIWMRTLAEQWGNNTGGTVKYLCLRILLLLILAVGLSPSAAMRLEEYKPVLSSATNMAVRDQTERLPVHTQPVAVQSSFEPSTGMPDHCAMLREFMEQLAHIYYNSRHAKQDRRLAALKSKFDSLTRGRLPRDLAGALMEYEELCQCVHKMRFSGLTLQEIYARRPCGGTTTKEKRMEILAKCKSCRNVESPEWTRHCLRQRFEAFRHYFPALRLFPLFAPDLSWQNHPDLSVSLVIPVRYQVSDFGRPAACLWPEFPENGDTKP